MSDLRALIEAARADAPSTAARANVWAGVSTVVGEAVSAASGVGTAAATGSVSAAKMLVLGTLLGGSVTVGVGAAVLFVGRAPVLGPTVNVATPAPAEATLLTGRSTAALARAATLNRAVGEASLQPSAAAAVVAGRGAAHGFEPGRKASTARLSPAGLATSRSTTEGLAHGGGESDTLAREASALAEARGALAQRDALSALQIVRSLRALPGRQLVPEELAVEAQALRGLGLEEDANAVEARLRVRFPDSVLGR
jgi:hypothetical protein